MDPDPHRHIRSPARELIPGGAFAIVTALADLLDQARWMRLRDLVIDPEWRDLATVVRCLVLRTKWTLRFVMAALVSRTEVTRLAAMAADQDDEGWIGAAGRLASIAAEARLGPPAAA